MQVTSGLVLIDQRTGLDVDLGDGAVRGRHDRRLHLHGLDHREHVAGAIVRPEPAFDLEDPAGNRGAQHRFVSRPSGPHSGVGQRSREEHRLATVEHDAHLARAGAHERTVNDAVDREDDPRSLVLQQLHVASLLPSPSTVHAPPLPRTSRATSLPSLARRWKFIASLRRRASR